MTFLSSAELSLPLVGGDAQRVKTYEDHLTPLIVCRGAFTRYTTSGLRLIRIPRLVFYPVGWFVGWWSGVRGAAAVVAQSPFEAVGVILLRRLTRGKCPTVVELHGDWRTATRLYGSRARRVLAPLVDAVARWTVRHADRVRAVGTHTAELAREAGFSGAIDTYAAFNDLGNLLQHDVVELGRTPTFIFVGRLDRVKGVDVLVDAFSNVAAAHPDTRLKIIGEGPAEQMLTKRISAAGLQGSVEMVGRVENHRLGEHLDAAWVLVLPSRSEGFPRVPLEAMARGRAVIATDVGNLREIVQDELTGWIVTPEESEALARIMIEAISSPARIAEMGRRGRYRIERPDWASFEDGVQGLAEWLQA